MSYTKTTGANFMNADLSGAVIVESDWACMKLDYAILQDADLSYTRLSGSKLKHVDLRGANLKYAKMEGAELDGVKLYNTKF